MQADAGRVEHANLLKPDRGMPWISFEEREVFVGERPNRFRKLAVAKPEVRVGEVVQSGVQRPAS